MDALHRHVRALFDGASGQFLREITVRAVGFVHHQDGVVRVADLRDPFQIAGDAVICRRNDQYALTVRILPEHLLHLARRDAAVEAPFRLDLRHDIHRFTAADDEPHQDGFMRVAGNGDLGAAVGRGDHHSLVAAGASVY